MKKLIFPFVLLCCTAFSGNLNAQVDVSINPIGILFGDLSVGADVSVSEKMSVEGAVGFGTGKIAGVKGSNVGLNIVPKYYFNPKNGADGFYIDAFLRLVNRSWKYDDGSSFADYSTFRTGLGFGLGYKVVSAGNFVFDIGFGAGRAIVSKNNYKDSTGTQTEINWTNAIFQGKLGIGYRFGGSNSGRR